MIKKFDNKKIRNICLMLLLIFGIGLITIKVGADSGWDTSYDSGGSSDWGSSSDGFGGSGGSGGGSMPTWAAEIFVHGFFIFILFILITSSIKEKKFKKEKQKKEEKKTLKMKIMMQENIKLINNDFDLEAFNKFIFDKFVNIQKDWMNFNYDGLRSNLSDELYNQYEMQLYTLKTKKQKNVMSDFKLLDCYIQKVSTQDNVQKLEVILEVSFKDYVINEKNTVVRGNKKTIYKMTYKLTFVRNIDGKVTKCPKCGSEINKNTNKCPYCRAVLNKISNEWVMSKKELLNQLDNSSSSSNNNGFMIFCVILMYIIFILAFILIRMSE